MWLKKSAAVLFALLPSAALANDGLQRFSELLGSVRAGSNENLLEFTQLADELARDLKRDDIRSVANYYVGLSADARLEGLRDYESFAEIWERVRSLSEEGVRGSEWREDRRAILLQLHELAERVEAKADFVPAARALSLSARLETEVLALAYREENPDSTADLFDRALDDAERSLELFRAAGQLRPQLEPLFTLARLERVLANHAISNDHFEECLELALAVGDVSFQEHALQGLVSLASRDGNLLEVDRLLHELAALRAPVENWPLTWRQAERLIHSDQPERALAFLDRYPPQTDANLSAWHVLRANAYTRLGNWDAARRETEASGNDPLRLARIDLGRGEPELALSRLASGITPGSEPDRRLLTFMTRGEAYLALDRLQEATHELEAARELSRKLETRLALEEGESVGRANIAGEVMGLFGTLLYAETLARDGRVLEAASAVEEAQARRLRSATEKLDLRAWAEHFEAGLITWITGPDRTLRISVPRSSAAPSFEVVERGRVELQRAVRRLREALCDGREELAREIGSEVVEDLFPAEAQSSGRVLLLLHGPLEGLPIEWLIEAKLLDADWIPTVLPGLPASEPGVASKPSSWSLLGGPQLDGRALLPAADAELRDLHALRPDAQLRAGLEFTEGALTDALAPNAGLHIATHMEEFDDGLRIEPRLILSNGFTVGPEEIRAAEPKLSICVLATCESGGGRFVDAEGAQGVAQAFLESGTRNLIVTTWPVSDEAGRIFSRALHAALLRGLSPSRATAVARAELRSSGFASADWAAFRTLGRD